MKLKKMIKKFFLFIRRDYCRFYKDFVYLYNYISTSRKYAQHLKFDINI